MGSPSADPASPLALTCPECGARLSTVEGEGEVVCCPSHHRFTLPSLLLGQSRRVAALCESGAQLLEEQERLVRQIADQLWNAQPLAAFRLEGRADQLRETRQCLRRFIREDFLGGPEAGKGDELVN